MIEQILIFALGFLTAGLAALLFLPAFWRRAMRLSRHKLEMSMPLSMVEIIAERDQLRAEFAAGYRRLEQKLESLNALRAQEKTSLGERLVRISRLDSEISALSSENTVLRNSLTLAGRERDEARAETATLAKENWDIEGLASRRKDDLETLRGAHRILAATSDEQRVALAALETRLTSLEAELDAALRESDAMRARAAQLQEAGDAIAVERDQFRADAKNAASRRDALQSRAVELESRIATLEESQRANAREEQKLLTEIATLKESIAQSESLSQSLKAQLGEQKSSAAAAMSRITEMDDLLRAAKAAAQGALETQRQENARLRAELVQARETRMQADNPQNSIPGSTHLRQSIVSLGAEMEKIAAYLRAQETESGKPAQIDLSGPMRALQNKAREAAGGS